MTRTCHPAVLLEQLAKRTQEGQGMRWTYAAWERGGRKNIRLTFVNTPRKIKTALIALIKCCNMGCTKSADREASKPKAPSKLSSPVSAHPRKPVSSVLRPACSQAWHTVLSQSLLATQAHTPTTFLHYEPEGRVRCWMRWTLVFMAGTAWCEDIFTRWAGAN